MFNLSLIFDKIRLVSALVAVSFAYHLSAQDTVKVMQYNILNYGNYTSYCTSANNNINTKNAAIRTIVGYVKPDILTVNEISQWSAFHQQLMDSALNVNGINYYQKVPFTNNAGSDIINMLYFNSNKLRYHSMSVLQTYVRDVNLYKLYYNSPQSLAEGDTAFIICIQAHLKAGSTQADAVDRDTMTLRIMRSLAKMNTPDNYLIMGDFNIYSANENAYRNLVNNTNENIRFYDPINKPGDWNNNSYFAPYHTQSTTTVSDCKSGGGLDDRFDFILVSNDIITGSKKVKYIDNSYKTIGNDGLHYNTSINASPQNNSVPAAVLNALFVNSDHLPVVLDLKVSTSSAVNENIVLSPFNNLSVRNIGSNALTFSFAAQQPVNFNLQIVNILGQPLISKELKAEKGENAYTIDVGSLSKGFYFVSLTDGFRKVTFKVVLK